MWQTYDFLAADRIRDRQREAASVALARRAVLEAGAQVGRGSRGRPRAVRVSAPRRVLAVVLRRVEAAAGSLAAAARGTAARLEGRPEGRVA